MQGDGGLRVGRYCVWCGKLVVRTVLYGVMARQTWRAFRFWARSVLDCSYVIVGFAVEVIYVYCILQYIEGRACYISNGKGVGYDCMQYYYRKELFIS